jgi:hypothetical protein
MRTWIDASADAPLEHALIVFAPWCDAREPMVALGEDICPPGNRHLTETQARPIAVGGEILV